MNNKCWLPKLELFEDYGNNWPVYEDTLYAIFKTDFITTHPDFDNMRVGVRHYPIVHDKEEAFYHTTCEDYFGDGERTPDLRRCERIRWIRAFIEKYDCDPTNCGNCSGVKVWREPYKNRTRVHILLEEERYLVILENRNTYYLLITAFYLDQNHSLRKQLKKYEQYH